MTLEADSDITESPALSLIAIKPRRAVVGGGAETPKKARKQADPTAVPGDGAIGKRGRKAALVFDDALPAMPAKGSEAKDVAEKPAASAQPAPAQSLPETAEGKPEWPAPDEEDTPVMVGSPPDPTAAAPEWPALEVTAPIIDIAEQSTPGNFYTENQLEMGFGSRVDEEMLAEPEPVNETAAEFEMPVPSSETGLGPEPRWLSETVDSSAIATSAEPDSLPDVPEAREPNHADPAANEAFENSQGKPDADAQSAQRSSASRFEAIARAARMNALSAAKPGIARTIAADAAKSAEVRKRTTEIFGYWMRAKNGRRYPSRFDFEIAKVAEFWPNSMLLTCGGVSPVGGNHISFSKVMRLDDGRNQSSKEFNFTSMIIDWILMIGGEAARVGQPVQDTEVFPTSDGTHSYKIVALPLSDHQSQIDHVLCHLTRS